MLKSRIPRFKPTQFDNCIFWIDASKIRQGHGTNVVTWDNLVNPLNSPTNANSANQPTFQAAGTYGRPAVRFDGANHILITPSQVLADDEFTMLAVVRGDPTTAGEAVLAGHDGTATVGRWQLSTSPNPGDTDIRFFFNNGSSFSIEANPGIGFDNVKPYLLRVTGDGLGTTAIGVNSSKDLASQTGQTWTPQNTGMRVGGIAAANNPLSDIPMDLQEVVIYSKLLRHGQLRLIERHLMHKWGVL